MTHITTEVEEEPIIRLAFNLGVENVNILGGEEINNKDVYMVFLNGNILGIVKNYPRLVHIFRLLRRKGLVNGFVSIFTQHQHRYNTSCIIRIIIYRNYFIEIVINFF